MKIMKTDIAVIGGGPAGLAAALQAKKRGIRSVTLIERNVEPGGMLQQCIHDGFGIHRFDRRMTGPEYAQRFVDALDMTDVDVLTDTMVLEITPDKKLYACNKKDGMMLFLCGAVILAMGCRERTASQALLFGYRPVGVMTAGLVQRYINVEGCLPGKNAVILGSGDIGLIIARRMTLEGIRVRGVYEVMPAPGGLTRNVVQCLDDFDIPLHLSTTVTFIHGKHRIEGVTVAKADERGNAIPGTGEYVSCDLLVLAVGLIPENELSVDAGVAMDENTRGPVLDNRFMTSVPGIFAAGNVAVVFDLVDYVSLSGEIAANGAADYIEGKIKESAGCSVVRAGENVGLIVPQRIRGDCGGAVGVFLRVRAPMEEARIDCAGGQVPPAERLRRNVGPPEMVRFDLACKAGMDITVDVKEVKA